MKNLVLAVLIMLLPALANAGASAQVEAQVSNGFFMGAMHADQIYGGPQQIHIKLHTGDFFVVTITDRYGNIGQCSIIGETSELVTEIMDTLAHVRDGVLLAMWHDKSVSAYKGKCTGFSITMDTRYMTVR